MTRTMAAALADEAALQLDTSAVPASPGALDASAGSRCVLVAGATGFIGHHAVLELLHRGWSHVVCLSRNAGARELLLGKLSTLPGWDPAFAARITTVVGDVVQPRLGCADYDALACGVDAVVHAAAEVRWTDDYETCRAAHVDGTRQVLAFARDVRAKHVVFVSSLAAVHWLGRAAARIDESTASFVHREALDWGYAQGKCVAEKLVLDARVAGLQAHIVRPALVWGHSDTGRSNSADILAAMVRGCIHMRAAPDMDWQIEACPVDTVARAIAALCPVPGGDVTAEAAAAGAPPEHVHVAQAEGRNFREWILWLNLHGYPVQLTPYAEWCALLRRNADEATRELRALLPFFTRSVGGTGLSLPEWYTNDRRPALSSVASEAWLRKYGVAIPPLDDAYVALVTAAYVTDGWLPPIAGASNRRRPMAAGPRVSHEELLREAVQSLHPEARIDRVEALDAAIDDSIMLETTAVRDADAALRPYRLHGVFVTAQNHLSSTVEVMLKRKPHADAMMDVVRCIAALAHPNTGVQVARAMAQLDVADCHRREIGVYRSLHVQNARYVPRLWGLLEDPARQAWVVVMALATPTRRAQVGRGAGALPLVARALAHLHAPWLRRESELQRQVYLGERRPAGGKLAMLPLWEALARHTTEALQAFVPGAPKTLPERVLAWLAPRWPALDALPQTLVHNDFSHRNSCVVDGLGGPELCVYDWEVAKMGAPQQDLMSWLCMLPDRVAPTDINATMEAHRLQLAQQAGMLLSSETWLTGVQLALADFLVDRLGLLAMLHRVRPTKILAPALRNWWRLAELVGLPAR